MDYLLHHSLHNTANRTPDAALLLGAAGMTVSAERFAQESQNIAAQLLALGLRKNQRVAIYLQKSPLCAYMIYATSLAGGIVVPVNPILKPAQVEHILIDSGAAILVTSQQRLAQLGSSLSRCTALLHVMLSEASADSVALFPHTSYWQSCAETNLQIAHEPPRIDNDVAALLYTSGSTGKPKGVIVSHRNLVEGAKRVSQYLDIRQSDRILALLPLSFDYGLNQLTTSVLRGASCFFYEYLFPNEVLQILATHKITGLAGVPPLWAQLATLPWPQPVQEHLRYITNSGGALPKAVLSSLRKSLPKTRVFLMYGLTEAFRSTYLDPELVDKKPNSIGKPLPNVEILIVRNDGRLAADDESGELVHRGALVTLGYWNDPERTALRYRPIPSEESGLPNSETAVWSGDIVKRDKQGFLYFLGRNDAMIKTSGYRVSPEEIEEEVYRDPGIEAAIALGVPDEARGQSIVVLAITKAGCKSNSEDINLMLRTRLPLYMQPSHVEMVDTLPRNANGKLDRVKILAEYLKTPRRVST